MLVDARHDTLPSVVIDDVEGGMLATRYLLELGHRRIAFIGDKPADEFRFDSSRDRTVGYERALADAGVPLRPEYVREGTQSRHIARNIAEKAALPERLTAIRCIRHAGARRARGGARLNIRVPGSCP